MKQAPKRLLLLLAFAMLLVRPVRDVVHWLYGYAHLLKRILQEIVQSVIVFIVDIYNYFFESLNVKGVVVWIIIWLCLSIFLFYVAKYRPLAVAYTWLGGHIRQVMQKFRCYLRPLSPYVYDWLARMEPRSVVCRWLKGRLFQRVARKGGIDIIPLTPRSDLRNIDGYSRMLTEALRNEDIRNIAVSGKYGAGKSSFLRTYFKNRNVLWVSLASFVNQDPKDNKSLTDQLEWSILQQMFYAAHAQEIPWSRFGRISRPSMWLVVLLPFYVAVLLAAVSVAFQPGWLTNAFKPFPLLRCEQAIVVAVYTMVILFFAGIVCLTAAIVRCRLAVSMSVKGVDVKFAKNVKTSAFNLRLDELIYYFETLSYEATIFEDIDRFQRPIVFTRLREINTILNSSRQICRRHKPIRFIYALRDDVFHVDMRVKFFDFILPIYPFMNVTIAYAQMESDLMEILGTTLSDEMQNFVRCISSFISDMRFWNNIVNEVRLSHFVSQGEWDARKTLAMILFKNIFPTDFDLAHEGKGLLVQLMSHDGPLVKCARERLESERTATEERINTLKMTRNDASEVADLDKQVIRIQEKLNSLQFQSLARLIAQLLVREDDLQAIVKKECAANGAFFGSIGRDAAAAFLFLLLETEAIGSDYADYLSLLPVKRLHPSDCAFVRECIAGNPPSGQVLHSPYGIISKLDAVVLAKTDIFNITIAKSLRKAYQRNRSDAELERKFTAYASRLSENVTVEKAEYLYRMMQSCPGTSVRDFWCNKMRESNPNIIEMLIALKDVDENKRQDVIARISGARLRAKGAYEITEALRKYINGLEDIESFIKSMALADHTVVSWLTANKVKFVHSSFLKLSNQTVAKAVVDNGLYGLNAQIVEALLSNGSVPVDSTVQKQPYGMILAGSHVSLREKVLADLSLFFKEIYPVLLHGEKANETLGTVLKVMQDKNLSDEDKACFLQENHLDLLPNAFGTDEELKLLLKYDAFVGTWENALFLYVRIGYSDGLRNMLTKRSDAFVRNKCDLEQEDMRTLLCAMIEDVEFNESVLLKLLVSVNSENRYVYNGDKITPSRLTTLAMAQFVEFTPEYYTVLRKAGRGAHLSLIRNYTKRFLMSYQEDWLDHNDAMALLARGPDGHIPVVGIVALRKAASLLARDSEVCELLAGNIKIKDFESSSFYSRLQKEMLLEYYSNATCRAYALVLKDRSAEVAWDCLMRFPEAVLKPRKNPETITVKVSVKIASQFSRYFDERGFAVRISNATRMPEVSVTRRKAM